MSVNSAGSSRNSAGADSMILADQANSFLMCEVNQTRCGVTRRRCVSVEKMTTADVDALAQFLRSRDLDVEDSTRTVSSRIETSPSEDNSVDDNSQVMDTFVWEGKEEEQDENESDSRNGEENTQENVLETEKTETVEDDENVAVSFLRERAHSVKREDESTTEPSKNSMEATSRAPADYSQVSTQHGTSARVRPSTLSAESDVIDLDETSSVTKSTTSFKIHPKKVAETDEEKNKKEKAKWTVVSKRTYPSRGKPFHMVTYTRANEKRTYKFIVYKDSPRHVPQYHCSVCERMYRKRRTGKPEFFEMRENGDLSQDDLLKYQHTYHCNVQHNIKRVLLTTLP